MIKLKKQFGEKYRVKFDRRSYFDDKEINDKSNPPVETKKEWLYEIKCKRGNIQIADEENELSFLLKKSSSTMINRIEKEMGDKIKRTVRADKEAVFYFDIKNIDEILKYAKPYKKRHISEEHKQKLLEAGKQTRFKKGFSTALTSTGDPTLTIRR